MIILDSKDRRGKKARRKNVDVEKTRKSMDENDLIAKYL